MKIPPVEIKGVLILTLLTRHRVDKRDFFKFTRDGGGRMAEDYMDLWVTKCLLIQDIRQRGVNTVWDNGGGQKGRKKNDSVDLLIKTNAQMLKLLADM
jgi:hypothetical protein